MDKSIEWVANATIEFDGMVREPANGPTDLYKVQIDQKSFWFEVEYAFAPNGNDFRLTVRNFGLGHKAAAGSRGLLPPFSAAEAAAAQARVEGFFMEARGNPALPNWLRSGRGRCLGVSFPHGWVRVA